MNVTSEVHEFSLREVEFHYPRGLSKLDVYREQSIDTELSEDATIVQVIDHLKYKDGGKSRTLARIKSEAYVSTDGNLDSDQIESFTSVLWHSNSLVFAFLVKMALGQAIVMPPFRMSDDDNEPNFVIVG